MRDIASGEKKDPEANKIIDYGFYYFRNFDKIFLDADLEEKHRILGSTFPEKLVFENKKGQSQNGLTLSSMVELQGIEPWSKHIRRKLSTCLLMH